jgi:hypothetical protein
MAAEINRNPRGVVELIDLNRQGIFPRVLGDEIQPSVDTAPFYYEGRGLEHEIRTQANVQIPGQVSFIQIPTGQVWAIRGLSMRLTNVDPVSVTATVSMLAFGVPAQFITMHSSFSAKTIFVGGFMQEGKTFEVPILLSGGTTISFNVDNLTPLLPAGVTVASSVGFYRLGL